MLFKKCLRDIKLNKSQFLNIFIMVFLGIFVFAGIHSYMDGMRTSGERFYENNNLADLWLSVIGIIIGLPLGSIMLKYIFEAALGDNYDFVAIVKTISYIYAAVGSYIVSVIVNKLLAKKVKNIDMVTSLKGNE